MIVEMVVPLAVCAALAVMVAGVHRHLPPALAARTITGGLVVVAVAGVPTLWVTSVHYLSHAPLVGAWFLRCAHALGHHGDVPHLVGLPAVVLSAWGLRRAGRTLRALRRLRVKGGMATHLVDDDAVYAVALPGRDAGIVMSQGLHRLLVPAEREVVLAHEMAHVRHRHDRYLLAAQLAADLAPVLVPVVRQLRFSLERWADEVAAEQCGDRTFVARTLGRVAVLADEVRHAVASASAGLERRHQSALAFAGLGVAARMEALFGPPVARPSVPARLLLRVAVLSAGVVAAFQWWHLAVMLVTVCHG